MALTLHATIDDSPGWAPVAHMVRLMADLLDADLQKTTNIRPTRFQRAWNGLKRARHGGDDVAIYVARSLGSVPKILAAESFHQPSRCRFLWVIDSFWTEHLPPLHTLDGFDFIAFTRAADRDFYEATFGDRVLHLGWGSDVLGLGSGQAERPVDVLRLGRQPPEWDDDATSKAFCAARGIRFAGRPAFCSEPDQQAASLMATLATTKFVIAHSNLAAPAPYTHPTKDYITGRWTDALAAGVTVAGCQPHGDLAGINWPGATLDFDRIDLAENVQTLCSMLEQWEPRIALQNHLNALRFLDWRWRFREIMQKLENPAPFLDVEIDRLQQLIQSTDRSLQDGSDRA